MACKRGEESDLGYLGAMIENEHYADIRMIRQALGVKVDGE